MKKVYFIHLFLVILAINAITLKEMYDSAPSFGEYDKYIELETGVTYTGGLYIGRVFNYLTVDYEGNEGLNVKIKGNGAILDLEGDQLCISFCKKQLDIENAVILNGNIRYRGDKSSEFDLCPTGSVKYVTMYKPIDFGIRLEGTGTDISLMHNIFVDAVRTGGDFQRGNSVPMPTIITGVSYAVSVNYGEYGLPITFENWSYFSKPDINVDSLRHFTLL